MSDVDGRIAALSPLKRRLLRELGKRPPAARSPACYGVRWVAAHISSGTTTDRMLDGVSAIVADEAGQAVEIASILGSRLLHENASVVVCRSGSDPRLRRADRILYLRFLALDDDSSAATLSRLCAEVVQCVGHLVQSGRSTRELWVVTRGAQWVAPGDVPRVWQAPAWGLVRAIALEHPEVRSVLVDLDASEPQNETLTSLAEVLRRLGDERELAVRSGHFLSPRLGVLTIPASAAALAPDGCYLVTGGTGALGRRVVRWLVQQGAREIVAVARRPVADAWLADVLAPEHVGVNVRVIQCDVSVLEEVDALIARLETSFKPLKGIVHAAGELHDRALLRLGAQEFSAAFGAKVLGAWNLERASRRLSLDFFVTFSSSSSLLGSIGQANYAAANAFLDALSHYRRARGAPSHSIGWGPWAQEGMAAERLRWDRHGIKPLAPESALELLGSLLRCGPAHTLVMDADWDRLARTVSSPRLLDALLERANRGTGRGSRVQARRSIRDLPDAERRMTLISLIRDEIASALGTDGALVGVQQPLMDLGLDSLMAMEVRNALCVQLDCALSPTAIFDFPSVELLAEYILTELWHVAVQDPRGKPRGGISNGADPIAIVGIGCRFPGAVDAESYWRLLVNGGDSVREVPRDRWNVDAYFDARAGTPGKMNTRWGGFIDDVDKFDPQAFGITPKEAQYMDPQQRILLEEVWHAFENANIDPTPLAGRDVGVFVGVYGTDYLQLLLQQNDVRMVSAYNGTGLAHSIAANRISFTHGFCGPSLAIDTACSSSLVSVHLACESLRRRETELCIAAGVNLMLSPEATISLSHAGMMSPDGACRAFDDAANGYVRGEGCGVLILKRLEDAQRDRDRVVAVIAGTAVNQDGRSASLTAPNGPSQAAVIAAALERAGLSASDVEYVEAHGTGTPLGDPIEARVLGSMYGRRSGHPIWIGSVKSNLGHLEAAAGVAGIVKTALALQHGSIPPHIHLQKVNRHIDADSLGVCFPSELVPWDTSQPRAAAVSSFGFGGTNAHAVLRSVPRLDPESSTPSLVEPAASTPSSLLCISAHTPETLRDVASAHSQALKACDDPIADYCASAHLGRRHLRFRHFALGDTLDELAAELAWTVEAPPAASFDPASSIACVFPHGGLGSIEPFAALYREQRAFRDGVDECDALLAASAGYSVAGLFSGMSSAPEEGDALADAIVVTLQYSLARLWQSWGVTPTCVVGYGRGEYSAGCISGALPLAAALSMLLDPDWDERADVRGRVVEALRTACRPRMHWLSSRTWSWIEQPPAVEYWQQQHGSHSTHRDPGLDLMRQAGVHVLLEVGTERHRVGHLGAGTSLVELEDSEQSDLWRSMLEALGTLYRCGLDVNWSRFHDGRLDRPTALPMYPFLRERYWFTSSAPKSASVAVEPKRRRNPLLGTRVIEPAPTMRGDA